MLFSMRPAPVYALLRPLARPLARLFHRRLLVEHPERVPSRGPVVLAANHPNMMLDVLLLAATQDRALHFLAKATLFHNPLLGRFLRASGVLPVRRRNESPGEMGENLKTFEACHDLLAEAGAIAIFPEGLSHEREAVLPLKTGCARIVLEAEAKQGFGLGTVIVPVGLSFSNRELFRSDALVVYGEPIDPSPHFQAYREGRAAEAVRALTAELETALRELALHVPQEEDERLLRRLREFFVEVSGPMRERLEVDRALVLAVTDLRERQPLEYARLRREILGYGRVLETLGVSHGELDRSYRLGQVMRYLAPRLLAFGLGLPPFLAGALFHYLPYKIPQWVARAFTSGVVERASAKLFTGLLTFPLFYALEIALLARFAGTRVAIGALLLMPFLGLFALVYLEALTEFLREARVFLLHLRPDARIERLRSWRGRLIETLEARRREYEALVNRTDG